MNVPLSLGQALSGGHILALPLALAGGVLAGMNPCCLALYPAAAGTCCSASGQQTIRRSFSNALAFVFGMALAISALGVAAAYLGRISEIAIPVKYAIAGIPIVMGMYRLGWVKFPVSTPNSLQPGLAGSFGTGLLLSLVIGPCGAPVLASVLSYAAYGRSFIYGGLLLFLIGLWTGVPLVLVGTTARCVLKRIDSNRFGHLADTILGA